MSYIHCRLCTNSVLLAVFFSLSPSSLYMICCSWIECFLETILLPSRGSDKVCLHLSSLDLIYGISMSMLLIWTFILPRPHLWNFTGYTVVIIISLYSIKVWSIYIYIYIYGPVGRSPKGVLEWLESHIDWTMDWWFTYIGIDNLHLMSLVLDLVRPSTITYLFNLVLWQVIGVLLFGVKVCVICM